MKKIALLIIMAISIEGIAQNDEYTNKYSKRLSTGFDIFNDFVSNPSDSIKFRNINQGVNIYTTYAFPIEKSNFAVAFGVGLGFHNLYSNSTIEYNNTKTILNKIPEKTITGDKFKYNKSKISLTYLDFPIELSYKNKNGLKVILGFKAGYLLNSHTKYKGPDFKTGKKIKIKQSDIDNVTAWRYGPTMQIGYRWVSLNAFYSITNVFDENNAPKVKYFSIGVSFRPY